MIIGVRELKSLYAEKTKKFGNKAYNLSYMMNCGFSVLPGFCVTFDMKQKYDDQISIFFNEIVNSYKKLLDNERTKSVIVRSSADIEDQKNALFPGVFKSFTSVQNQSELFDAIYSCFCSAVSPNVFQYAKAKNISLKIRYFTVIIQLELKAEYSGIAATRLPFDGYQQDGVMLTHLTKGNNHNLVKGMDFSNTYSLYESYDIFRYRKIDGKVKISKTIEKEILNQLYFILNELRKTFQYELDVEWGFSKGTLYVFQARFLATFSNSSNKNQTLKAFKNDIEQGLKYQSMKFFCSQGLFLQDTFFFPKKTSLSTISNELLTCDENASYTVRYSREREIGLPRFFSKNLQEAIDFIIKTKEPEWSVIVYKSISVFDSYELYIDKDKMVIEHIPGIWESDSNLMADTIVLTHSKLLIWLAKERRIAKFTNYSGSSYFDAHPTHLDDFLEQLYLRLPTFRKLQSIFQKDLPINLHFVSDGTQDYFLNCRTSSNINFEHKNPIYMHKIKDICDCNKWDGKSNILFSPDLNRGEELFIYKFVPFLKSVPSPIFVEFGILSHPAIMLREFNIPIMPIFVDHKYYEIPISEIKKCHLF